MIPLAFSLIRVEPDNGDVEILATSLTDRNLFPRTVFKEFYMPDEPARKVISGSNARWKVAAA